MFFVERVPRVCDISCLRNLFLPENKPFMQSARPAQELKANCFNYVPALCSELFFSQIDIKNDSMVLVLVNDAWFPVRYQQDLMAVAARFNALLLQKDILYISYSKAGLYTKDCSSWSLNYT